MGGSDLGSGKGANLYQHGGIKMKYYKSHRKFIEKHFGLREANRANYGWSVSEDSYISKIYTKTINYVVTYRNPETNRLAHGILG